MIMYPMAVGGRMTRVLEAGSAGRPVMVLVHGLTSRADRWRGNIDALAAAGYHVYAPDLPGHGLSVKDPATDHSVPAYGRFLLDFLDAIGAEKAVLVGTSMGGFVAGDAACTAPERVAALVVIGSAGFREVPSERIPGMRQFFSDMSPAAVRTRLLTVFSDPRHVTDELVAEDMRINTSPGAVECLDRFLDYMATGVNGDLLTGRINAVAARAPVLMMWGEQDNSIGVEVGRAAHANIPGARLVTFANTNHTPYMERPLLFNRTLLAFLAGTLKGPLDPLMTYA